MPVKRKNVNKNVVQKTNKQPALTLQTWDDLIALAERHILIGKIKEEELTAAIRLYSKRRDAGLPFPGDEQIDRQLLEQ